MGNGVGAAAERNLQKAIMCCYSKQSGRDLIKRQIIFLLQGRLIFHNLAPIPLGNGREAPNTLSAPREHKAQG